MVARWTGQVQPVGRIGSKGRAATGHAFDAAVKKQCREMAEDNLGKRKRKRDRSREDKEAINRLEQFQVACDFEFEEV